MCLDTSVHVGMASSSPAGELYLVGQMTLPRGTESQGSRREARVGCQPCSSCSNPGPCGCREQHPVCEELSERESTLKETE